MRIYEKPRWHEIEQRLIEAGCRDGLGMTIAALIADLYPVPVPYTDIAKRLEMLTGIAVERRLLCDWLTAARRRLEEAISGIG